jgi:ketosteroid isomerase-like protein
MDEVKTANLAYYDALSARDLAAMAQVWEQSAEATNIAPPIRPVAHVGWPAVRKNYEQFWSSLRSLAVTMQNPAITMHGDVAWVHGIEQSRRVGLDGAISGGFNYGTSIFIRREGRWRMVFHQAAVIPAP